MGDFVAVLYPAKTRATIYIARALEVSVGTGTTPDVLKLQHWPANESPVSTFDACPYFCKFPDTGGHVWEEEQRFWPFVHRVDPPVLHLAASVDAAARGKPPVHMLSHASQTMLAALVKKYKVGDC